MNAATTTRKVQSFDAGMAANEQGLPRDTETSAYFVERSDWLAGWDEMNSVRQEWEDQNFSGCALFA